jgi:uncharacterized protein (TIGR03382 family)
MVTAYGHHSSGGIASFVAHSIVWHLIGRLIYTAPIPATLAAGGLALVFLVLRRHKRR